MVSSEKCEGEHKKGRFLLQPRSFLTYVVHRVISQNPQIASRSVSDSETISLSASKALEVLLLPFCVNRVLSSFWESGWSDDWIWQVDISRSIEPSRMDFVFVLRGSSIACNFSL